MKYDFDYKKTLGQNFLIDNNIIDKIVGSIDAKENDLILEIGPGAGALTKKLVNKTKVIAFEIDTRLEEALSKIENNNLRIIFEDFLKVDIKKYLYNETYNKLYVVGNLPYYITTAIIKKIIDEIDIDQMTIMIQKEVADRFMAKPCTKDYSSISVYLQYYFDIVKVCDVSKNCFEPIPKVDSCVISLKKRNREFIKNIDIFNKLVRDSFQYKRKNLKNNLRMYPLDKIEEILNLYDLSLSSRAEQLSLKVFIDIANKLG